MLRRFEALFGAVAVLAGLGSAGLAYRDSRHAQDAGQPVPRTAVVVSAIPTAAPTAEPSASPTPTAAPAPLPPSLRIKGVPYTVQSPFLQWGANDPHQEYCEAAAVLMVGRYYRGDSYPNDRIPPPDADQAMAQIVAWERQQWPGVLDLSLDRVGQVGHNFYPMRPHVAEATLEAVKAALAAGHPVLLPVNTHGGPQGKPISPNFGSQAVYHVLVLTGYDGTSVYANDAGFSQGQNFRYDWPVLVAAMDAQSSLQNPQSQGRVMLTFTPGP